MFKFMKKKHENKQIERQNSYVNNQIAMLEENCKNICDMITGIHEELLNMSYGEFDWAKVSELESRKENLMRQRLECMEMIDMLQKGRAV